MIFERSPNTSYTYKPQTLNSLNGKVFNRYEDKNFVGLGCRTVEPWEATHDTNLFDDNFGTILLSFT